MKSELKNNVIQKSAQITGATVTAQDLQLINQYAIRELTAEEVFVFRVAIATTRSTDPEVFPRILCARWRCTKAKPSSRTTIETENQVARFDTEINESRQADRRRTSRGC